MGIIAALLFAQGLLGSTFYVPFYVILLAGTAMGFGTYFGGWRIVRTMGMKITKLHPFGGFSAETAAASTLFATASLGIPVSTTHTIAGAIMGVGSTRRLSAVRWGVARRIVCAWVLTIPRGRDSRLIILCSETRWPRLEKSSVCRYALLGISTLNRMEYFATYAFSGASSLSTIV